MRWTVVILVLVILMTAACGGAATPQTAEDAELPWWNDRVFYEIFVRSFKDSNGDGVGDLRGLTESLDYLNDGDPDTHSDLGITGIWLMPVFESPSYHGYDVVDYRTIESDYGTLEDFRAFLDAAHDRDVAVIIDLVLNHTSDEHPWFQASRGPDSPFADWYLWADDPPDWRGPWNQRVWHELDERSYYALFWEEMPDLNLENPEVTAELYDIADFWLEEVGVDGFRVDAARHFVEAGPVQVDTPASRSWLVAFQDHVEEVKPDALIVGEVWAPTSEVARYVPDSVDIAFDFDLTEAGAAAFDSGHVGPILEAQQELLLSYPPAQVAVFLANHDMPRVLTQVGGNVEIAKLAATLLIAQPGVPFLYYGEEIGLAGGKPDERIRTPMPWTGEEPGVGFTEGEPWETPDPGFALRNVAAETDDPNSLLSHYRTLVHARSAHPALRYGDTLQVETGSSTVLAFLRSIGESHVLVVANIGERSVSGYALHLAEGPLTGVTAAHSIIGPGAVPPQVTPEGGLSGYRPVDTLPEFGSLVIELRSE